MAVPSCREPATATLAVQGAVSLHLLIDAMAASDAAVDWTTHAAVDASLRALVEPWLAHADSQSGFGRGMFASSECDLQIVHASSGVLVVSFVVTGAHVNLASNLHGGFVAWLVDELTTLALMAQQHAAHAPIRPGVSVHLAVEYVGAASLGQRVWAEARVDRCGRALAFTSARLLSDPRQRTLIATARHTKYLNSGNPVRGKLDAPDAKL